MSTNRINIKQAEQLYTNCSLHELGRQADDLCRKLHPEDYRTYVVDRNINYTNVCVSGCAFCNFYVRPGDDGGYVLTDEQILAKIAELRDIGGNQILLQGGMHPELKLAWYSRLLRTMKNSFSRLHVHGFSPPEIVHLAELDGSGIKDVLSTLKDAGLDTIPGGGAEILSEAVRRRISPQKCSTDQWLDVMCQAHQLGIRSTATMMFGHVESLQDRMEHLDRIRQLQDQTGGFTAFIPWTYQPGTTKLARDSSACPADEQCMADGRHLHLAGAMEYLRTLAICRLFFDNIANIQASWVTQGEKIAQLALFYGANDLGSVMMEENVVASAGVRFRLSEQQLRRIISQAAFEPHRRNCYYQIQGTE